MKKIIKGKQLNNLVRKNGTKSCGCLVNLDKANETNIVQGTNIGNIKRNTASDNSTTGIKGVHFSKTQGLYVATIGFQGKQYYLTSSTDINICITARKKLKNKYMEISLNGMKTVKKIGIPNIKIQYPYNITKFSSVAKAILRVNLCNNKVFRSR